MSAQYPVFNDVLTWIKKYGAVLGTLCDFENRAIKEITGREKDICSSGFFNERWTLPYDEKIQLDDYTSVFVPLRDNQSYYFLDNQSKNPALGKEVRINKFILDSLISTIARKKTALDDLRKSWEQVRSGGTGIVTDEGRAQYDAVWNAVDREIENRSNLIGPMLRDLSVFNNADNPHPQLADNPDEQETTAAKFHKFLCSILAVFGIKCDDTKKDKASPAFVVTIIALIVMAMVMFGKSRA